MAEDKMLNTLSKEKTKDEDTYALRFQKWETKRQTLRKQCTFSENIKVSQQLCAVQENRNKLEGILGSSSSKFIRSCVLGLQCVLDILVSSTFIKYNDAYDIYAAYFEHMPDKDAFTRKLLDADFGLCCCIVRDPHTDISYVLLRNKDSRPEEFLELLLSSCRETPRQNCISPDIVGKLLSVMDTEFDKKCLKAILATEFSSTSDQR